MINAINWFEIPVKDYDRAKKFYSAVLGQPITDMPMEGGKYGTFPYDQEKNGTGGGIVQFKGGAEPSPEGVTIYLNAGEDLSDALTRVEPAGGKVMMPKTDIGENGFMAHFIDTEGNRLALHSMN